MTDTIHLALPMIAAAQAQKHVTHNEALRALDALVMLAVLDREHTAPPGSPAEGARYLVKATGTGGFAGKDGQVAHFRDGAFAFHVPRAGWIAYVVDEEIIVVHNGSNWEPLPSGGISSLQDVPLFGLATIADSTNPISAVLNNALFAARNVADGGDGDLRYKLSKESASDTVSLLLQDNFSGRAEIGLAGDDDLHLKVSSDGTTWREGLVIEASTGKVSFPQGATGLREKLTADRTYYVRTDGSDSHDGLTNSSGGAFLTIQKALTATSALDCSIYNVTIQVANGAYNAANVWAGHIGSGSVTLRGDPATPSNVTITVTGGHCLTLAPFSRLTVTGVKLSTITSGNGIFIKLFSYLELGAVEFGACVHSHMRNDGGYVFGVTSYAVSGSATRHIHCGAGGTFEFGNLTLTLLGTPAWGGEFIYGSSGSRVLLFAVTMSGSATGKRYSIDANAVVNSFGAGTASTYFPGSSNGTTSSGAQQI